MRQLSSPHPPTTTSFAEARLICMHLFIYLFIPETTAVKLHFYSKYCWIQIESTGNVTRFLFFFFVSKIHYPVCYCVAVSNSKGLMRVKVDSRKSAVSYQGIYSHMFDFKAVLQTFFFFFSKNVMTSCNSTYSSF